MNTETIKRDRLLARIAKLQRGAGMLIDLEDRWAQRASMTEAQRIDFENDLLTASALIDAANDELREQP